MLFFKLIVDGPDSFGGADRVFTITGTRENIDRCKRVIDDILKRGANPGANDPVGYNMLKNNIEIFEMKVAGNKCGLIIGKGGETIKSLSEQYGVKLVVVQETSAPSSGDKPLRITGEPAKVAKAKEAVMALLNPQDGYKGGGGRDDRNGGGRGGGGYGTNDYGSKSGDRRRDDRNGGNTEVFIKVPGDKAGIVIGKGKQKRLKKHTNALFRAHNDLDIIDLRQKKFTLATVFKKHSLNVLFELFLETPVN